MTVRCDTTYPLNGHIVWHITSDKPLRLRIRIPAWAEGASAHLGGDEVKVKLGTYLEVERTWHDTDTLELLCPMKLRTSTGEREQLGKVSIYRGPLLLAYDQSNNPFDEAGIPTVVPSRFADARLIATFPRATAPWLLVEISTAKGPLRLRDFASAGASGTHYRSWLAGAPAELQENNQHGIR